uniref:Uncharacterized protein n=1 Tax=Phyllymenia taiwanensis TaxID=1260292 RepID=R9XZC3_9FLOR|nr:hypothetical protein [Grateloupia taiwanensis]AGO19773.1 hypothetical protein [Grateloupia taiwanensis]
MITLPSLSLFIFLVKETKIISFILPLFMMYFFRGHVTSFF